MRRPRVLVADDNPLFREGLRLICETRGGFEVVGEASTGQEAVEMATRLTPDVVLMSISSSALNGIQATRHIVENDPSARVIILTAFTEDSLVFEAIKVGARGYLLKDADWHELVEAILVASQGGAVMTPSVASKVLDELRRTRRPGADGRAMEALTRSEMGILIMVAEGMENDAIAEKLCLTEKTIANRLSELYRKLGVTNRTQAALLALKRGWATLERN